MGRGGRGGRRRIDGRGQHPGVRWEHGDRRDRRNHWNRRSDRDRPNHDHRGGDDAAGADDDLLEGRGGQRRSRRRKRKRPGIQDRGREAARHLAHHHRLHGGAQHLAVGRQRPDRRQRDGDRCENGGSNAPRAVHRSHSFLVFRLSLQAYLGARHGPVTAPRVPRPRDPVRHPVPAPRGSRPHRRERGVARFQRPVDVGVGVRERDVELLVRVHEDAALEQLDRPAQIELLVGGQQVLPGPERRAVGEPHAPHGVLARRLHREPVPGAGRGDLAAQPSADPVEVPEGAGPAQHVERRVPGARAHRVTVQRSAGPHEVRAVGAAGVEVRHEIAAARDRGHRETAGHRLAVGSEVGDHAVPLLRTAPGDPESGDDLVEDQHDAVPPRSVAQRLEEPRHRHEHALERLHEHRGQLVRVPVDQLDGAAGVVERRDEHRAPQRVVVHAVPAALELEHLLAAGRRPGEPQRKERRLRARPCEVHLVGARDRLHQALREADHRLVQKVVGGALGDLALDGLHDLGMRVPEERGPRSQVVVDEVPAGHVDDVAPAAFGDDQVHVGGQHEQAEPAAGQIAAGTIEEVGLAARFGALDPRHHRGLHASGMPQTSIRAPAPSSRGGSGHAGWTAPRHRTEQALRACGTAMKPETRLVHAGRDPEKHHGTVNPPVYRASTILYPTVAAYDRRRERRYTSFYYGIHGTPTTLALTEALAELSGGYRSVVTSSGLAAISQALTAFLRQGDHVLVADTVYEPTRAFCTSVLARFGVEVTFYDPHIGAGIEALLRPGTRVVYAESPGSLTFEVQDVPAIARAAHARGAIVMLDNTWATPLNFRAFEHGVDVEIQAATKYLAGHSDLLMGVITTRTEELFRTIKDGLDQFGDCVSPDLCYETLRGLRTLAVRLRRHERSALEVARWLARRPEVARVLHPALPEDPGHGLWARDFLGSSSLFGVLLRTASERAVAAMLDGLRLFKIGASFGGFESLIVPARPAESRTARPWREPGTLLRLHVGLEAVEDLIADLDAGLGRLNAALGLPV